MRGKAGYVPASEKSSLKKGAMVCQNTFTRKRVTLAGHRPIGQYSNQASTGTVVVNILHPALESVKSQRQNAGRHQGNGGVLKRPRDPGKQYAFADPGK